jgi:hypothetical protein
MRFAAVAGQRSMSDMSTYVWRCLDGHEFAVSEETMRLATIQPRCGMARRATLGSLAGCDGIQNSILLLTNVL